MLTVPALLALLGAAYWLHVALNALRVSRSVDVLEKLSPPEPLRWPKLTLVIPARNEAAELEGALRSRLLEDYPELELVVVDDRSTDATGEILDRIAAEDPRVVPIHVRELPAGWLGKLHAMHRGIQRAGGEWILFTDADVHFQPGTLRRAVAHAEARGLDHLAALPTVWRGGAMLDAVIAFMLRQIFTSFRAWEIEDPQKPTAAGCGAFNLVRRSAYERTPGFEWLRMEVGDDAALGQMLKSYGGRSAFLNGRRLIHLRFYESIRHMAVNVEKAAGIGALKPPVLMAVAAVFGALELLPFACAALPQPPWARAVALGTCALAMGLSVQMNRWMAQPAAPALLFPLGAVLSCGMMFRSAALALWRGGVPWRGTFYPLEELHRGSRFRLFGPFHRPPRTSAELLGLGEAAASAAANQSE
ncbi:MAG TPA: glycosyltransferase [Myxococcales bacterium]|jgi:cellulose synthase/poly-beta-1,6-N-acetylglucosamine synthase-like glycosyltransferase|nr:glycosyltransferase [Myxococcales bacterium]